MSDKALLAAGSGPSPTAPLKPFLVYVRDTFYYMDESEHYDKGRYDTYEQALQVCRNMVFEDLLEAARERRTPTEMFSYYTMFGLDPVIDPDAESHKRFSAWDYAKQLCDARKVKS